MIHIDLFSGIGGFCIAAEQIGWQTLATCEIDPFCRKVLQYHFPAVYHHENIKTLDYKKLNYELQKRFGRNWRNDDIVLTGGFPCQPFSAAGSRKGSNDDRYLWPEMLRVIDEIRPTWVVAENVDGIVSMVQPGNEFTVESQAALFEASDKETMLEQEYIIETICRDFESIGYSVQPVIIPACGIGAPHRRYRIWFIAHSQRARGAQVFQEIESKQSNGKRPHGIGGKQTATNTDGNDVIGGRHGKTRKKNGKDKSEKNVTCNGTSFGISKETFTPNAKNAGCETCAKRQRERQSRRGNQRDEFPNYWRDWPTQSPICSRDDELSSTLDGITFSKWRSESIKALGNAVVPALVYEIFKAIDNINDSK